MAVLRVDLIKKILFINCLILSYLKQCGNQHNPDYNLTWRDFVFYPMTGTWTESMSEQGPEEKNSNVRNSCKILLQRIRQ